MGQLRSLTFALLASIVGCSTSTTAADAGGDAFAMNDAAGANDVAVDTLTPMTDAAGASDAMLDAATPTVTITNLMVYGDCMPIVAPDPIHASWTATIDGRSARRQR